MLCVFTYAQQLLPRQDNKGKYGFVDESGEFVIKPQYDEIWFEFSNGIACVRIKDKYTLINEKGKTVSKSAYTWVGNFSENRCPVNRGGKRDNDGNISGGKYGFINEEGKEIIPVKYNYIGRFNRHGIAIMNVGGSIDKEGEFTGGKYGFINLMGKEVVKPQYTRVGEFDEAGIAWTNIGGREDSKTGLFGGGKFGYIQDNGIEIVAPKYSFVGKFADGICWVNIGGAPYKIDKKTQQKISDKSNFLNQLSAKMLKGGEEFRKRLEKKLSDTLPNRAAIVETAVEEFKANMEKEYGTEAIRQKLKDYRAELLMSATGGKKDVRNIEVTKGKYGFIDVHGRELTKVKYTQTANEFCEERAWVAVGKKYGYIDNSGREITKIAYEAVVPQFYNRMAGVKQKGRWGFVNHAGMEITELKFIEVGSFEAGLASAQLPPVKKGKSYTSGKYGFINQNGQPVTEFKYDLVMPTVEGMTGCFYNGGWCYINPEGKEITSNRFLTVLPYKDGVAWAKVTETESQPALTATDQQLFDNMIKMQSKANNSGMLAAYRRSSYLESVKTFVKTYAGHPGYFVLVGKDGKLLSDLRFTSVTEFSEGLAAAVLKDQGCGYIDRQGKIVIPFRFLEGGQFHNNIARVQGHNYLYGYIDKNGEELIPCRYVDATLDFENGIAGVKIDGKWGGITPDDEVVIPPFLDKKHYVRQIEAQVYTPAHKKILTPRQVKVFNIYQGDERNSFSINTTIPDNMWDF